MIRIATTNRVDPNGEISFPLNHHKPLAHGFLTPQSAQFRPRGRNGGQADLHPIAIYALQI
jgi:hypothetical protein